MVRRPPNHLHPGAAGQQERRLLRRGEELGGGPHNRRLLPLRHRCRTVATQRDLAVAVETDQLLLPAAEAGIEGPAGRQGIQEPRQSPPSISSRHRSPTMTVERIVGLTRTYSLINPAAT